MEDSVLHGCIPVIIQDGVHTPWESVLDAPSYSIRVRREQLPSLVDMLRAMPAEKILSMQAALARVWPRFSYLGAVAAEARRRGDGDSNGLGIPGVELAAHQDAVSTLLQVLKVRSAIRSRREAWRGGRLPEELAPQPGCKHYSPWGTDISDDPNEMHAVARGAEFEGRVVNGWVI